jgi:hypothetical protein
VPETLQNEAIYDYQALTGGEQPPPAEGENVGGGSSSDFIDVPVSDGSEVVAVESREVVDEEDGRKKDGKADEKKPGKETPRAEQDSTRKKKKFFQRIFGKKDGGE